MADTDFTSVYRQFFEEFAKTLDPKDPLPIDVPAYNLAGDEMTGELIESCVQYLTVKKCPQSLFVPLLKTAVEEIQNELKKNPKRVYDPLEVMHMSTSKINEICLRYTDNEKLSSLPAPVKEPYISHHGVRHSRRKMEDRHVCLPRFNTLFDVQSSSEVSYYGLFDGHVDASASSFAVSHLHQFLVESEHYPHDPVSAFREAYEKTDSRYSSKRLRGGTTAIAVLHLHEERKLVVSWLGDSQAMLVTREGYFMLVDPHKPSRKDEYERINNLGGFVWPVGGFSRVNGQLAVSRAIGDDQHKPFVSAEPDVRVVDLTGSEEFMVIACDGLWDVVEPVEAIEAVYAQMKEKPDNIEAVSRRLIDLAKANKSKDNISVIVVFFADPVDISKRSVEATGPGPKNVSQGEMDSNFHTATEKSPFVALSDQGMNRIYEENGRHHTDYMDQLKEDSDEDFGPETDIDAVDDVLVSPTKCMNPFASDMWKKGGSDCDAQNDLIDCSKKMMQEDLGDAVEVEGGVNPGKDAMNFADNINHFLDNGKAQSVDEFAGSEPVDGFHANELNSHPMDENMSDSQNIKFSNYSSVNNEFIEDIKFDKESERAENGDHSFPMEKDEVKAFGGVNDFMDFDKFKSNMSNDLTGFDDGIVVEDGNTDLTESNAIICNGNAENHADDAISDAEKAVTPVPPEEKAAPGVDDNLNDATATDTNAVEPTNEFALEPTNEEVVAEKSKEEEFPIVSPTETCEIAVSSTTDSTLNVPQIPSDSDSHSQRGAETPELLSPTIPPSDEKLKDDIVADSGGEVDSEDDEWNYIKVGSSAPADERIDSVNLSPQVAETETPTMNSPLNPNAAEFIPVLPVTSPVEMDVQKTPLRSIPASVTDIIASSPDWTNMDNVDVPDETSFLTEIKSRPSNIFLEDESPLNDSEALGCTQLNLDNKEEGKDFYFGSGFAAKPVETESVAPEVVENASPSPVHGIALATDMTSSFIDTSTMSSEPEIPKQELELLAQEREAPEPETHTMLNVDAMEFKSELTGVTPDLNQLPDLLSPLPVEEEVTREKVPDVGTAAPLMEPEANLLDITETLTPQVESSPVQEMIPDIQTSSVAPPQEVLDLQLDKPEKLDVAEVASEPVQPVVEVASPEVIPDTVPEPVIKPEEPTTPTVTPVETAAAAVAAVAATAVGAAAAVAAVTEKKEEPKKAAATPKAAPAASKVMKSAAASPKTPPSATRASPAVKKQATPLASKPATTKPVNTSVSSPTSIKAAPSRVTSTTTRTATTKSATSTTAPRPLARKTTPTTASKTTAPAAPKPLPSKPSTAPVRSTTTTTATPRVTSTVAAPKPKPRVPSAPIDRKSSSSAADGESKTTVKRTEITKRPGVTSTTVTTTTRSVTSRPISAPIKSAVKTTTTATATRTTTTKPRTSLTGVTTTTTTTTRTVLNSKKPLSVTKDVPSKPVSKTVVSKVNGLANGKVDSTANKVKKTSVSNTASSKTKIENKTETKAENVIDPSVDLIQNEIENPVIENNKDVNLINGIDHE